MTDKKDLMIQNANKVLFPPEPKEVPAPSGKFIRYSEELVDKIAEKISMDMTFAEIAKLPWAPCVGTMHVWARKYEYVRYKFREASTVNLELRKKDKLRELAKTDFDKMAQDIANRDLPRELASALFNAKVRHVYKQMENIYKELEIELPKKYNRALINGEKTSLDEFKTKDLNTLKSRVAKLIHHPALVSSGINITESPLEGTEEKKENERKD